MTPPDFDQIREIEIEPTSGCTRRCWFCHPGIPLNRRAVPEFVSVAEVRSLAGELASLGYCRLVTLCGLGEPLMHPRVLELAHAARSVPGASVMVYTNGDLASEELMRHLNPLVDVLVFSDYDGNDAKAAFLRAIFGGKLRVESHVGRSAADYHSRAGNIRPVIREWRGGGQTRCHWFRHKLFYASNGLWTTCCNDMARVNQWHGGIADLLASNSYRTFRAALAAGCRRSLDPCRECERK